MLQTGFHNALAAVDQIVHIIQRVEVADRGDAVFVHQLRVQFDDVARLRIQTDHVDAARQRLQIGGRSGNLAEIVHHLKRVLIGIEISGLKQRAASRLEVGDSGSGGFFDHRQEVLGKYPRPEYRLETVPERRHHEIYFFHTALSYIIISGTAQYPPHGENRRKKSANRGRPAPVPVKGTLAREPSTTRLSPPTKPQTARGHEIRNLKRKDRKRPPVRTKLRERAGPYFHTGIQARPIPAGIGP